MQINDDVMPIHFNPFPGRKTDRENGWGIEKNEGERTRDRRKEKRNERNHRDATGIKRRQRANKGKGVKRH